VVAAAIAEPTVPAPTPIPTDEPSAPTGETIVSAAPLPVPNPFVLLGTLLLALAAAAGQVFRNDPLVLRRLVQGFDGLRGRAPQAASGAGVGPEPAADAASYETSGGSEAYETFDGTASATYPGVTQADALHEYSSASTLPGSQSASGLGGQGGGLGGAEQWSNGAHDALTKSVGHGPQANGFAHANGFDAGGFDASGLDGSSLGSADPGAGQDLVKQAAGQGSPSPADALGQDGSKIADLHSGGSSGSDLIGQSQGGGSFGGASGDGGLAKVPTGAGSELAHGGLSGADQGLGTAPQGLGGSQGSLGGSTGADALARPAGGAGNVLAHGSEGAGQMLGHGGLTAPDALGHGGLTSPDAIGQVAPAGGDFGSSSLGGDVGTSHVGGSQGFGHGGDTLAKSLTPPFDPAQAAPTTGGSEGVVQASLGVDPGLSQSLDELARALPPVDGATVAGGGVTSPEPVGTVAGGFGPAWLAAGALARATLPDPLPRVVRCPACDRPFTSPGRFCGYCGEPMDKTLA
jgi:hypothetical protein